MAEALGRPTLESTGSRCLTVAVRNLGGAFYPGNRYRDRAVQERSWDSLIAMEADLCLAQEATGVGTPFVAPAGWRAQPYTPLDRGSGSVVAIASHVDADLTWRPEHPVLDAFGAYLDFALVRALDESIAIVSVHVPPCLRESVWLAAGNTLPVPSGMRRPWSSDLMLDALHEALDGRPAILAGDWNEAPNWPSLDDPGTIEWFARGRRQGLVEVVSDAFGGPVRTNFARGTKNSYQNDHVFVTTKLAEQVRSVAVWNEPGRTVSDHAGIVVTLALAGG